MRENQLDPSVTESPTTDAQLKLPSWIYGNSGRTYNPDAIKENGYPLKRLFDIVVVLAGLLISAPLWLIFAICIKLEDRGPVFFVQERWGKNKTRFNAYKFRTMVPNAVEKFGHIQALEHDPRVTRIGRLMRATSLDETPQLINILKGDMSWVGPRALPIDEIQLRESDQFLPDEAIPGFEVRARVRPGLTGIAQIFAPRDVSREVKYHYDAVYAVRQHLWMDIRLIFLSLWITIRARWEKRDNKL